MEEKLNLEALHRPPWIKLDTKPLPRFATVTIDKKQHTYKRFGLYHLPVDYTNEEEQQFMDQMAEEYDDMVARKFNIPMAQALLERLPLDTIPKDASILDLGAGTGIMTELLLKKGFSNITLVDFSENMLAQAKKKLGSRSNIRYECLDITRELPSGMFDLVVSVMLFNSFDDHKTERIILKLILQLTPNAVVGILEDQEKPAYKNYFTPIFSGIVNTGLREKYIFIGNSALQSPKIRL